jgi:hypothetical protein
MVRIASVRCLEGFTVELGFTDGTLRTLDLDPLIRGPIFEPLRRDPALFRAVRVDPAIGTVVWPNGADLDPDVLRWDLPVVAPDAR